jgi:hypothetical protein
MRPPGQALRVSGGDAMLGPLWLKPAQLDALLSHHAAALYAAADAGDAEAALHNAAWLRDLARTAAAREAHRRAATAERLS